MSNTHRMTKPAFAIGAALFCLVSTTTRLAAQTQFQGICAQVHMEIAQELTLERVGFLATLRITNNVGDADLTNFSAALTFENPALSTESSTDDSSSKFFVQPPELSGISDITGTGIIPPGATAEITWFIIPKISAGGTELIGTQYLVGVDLGAHVYGEPLPPELTEVSPDQIVVKPEPQLEIHYFQPRDVAGDNPFTLDIVEAPVPFTLGVLVNNVGYGPAHNVAIDSEQPEIVESQQGLLLVAQLLGSRVDDDPTDYSSLAVNLGDINPGHCRKAAWDMITTLSGEFTAFDASFTHASELGGIETSLIVSVDAHFIAHEVRNDRPGQDDLLDFLADTIDDPQHIPDAIYTTNCDILPVNHVTSTTVDSVGYFANVHVDASIEDWIYVRVTDPLQDYVPIGSVARSDGKIIDPHNVWTNHRFDPITNERLPYLNILDYVAIGQYTYSVTYAPSGPDFVPPVTTLHFAGESDTVGGVTYITRDTQMFYTVEDASPVGTYRRLDGVDPDPYEPFYPFKISTYGPHALDYYSEDFAGNSETPKTAQLNVSGEAPGFSDLQLDVGSIVQPGQTLSIRPDDVEITFQGVVTAGRLDGEVEVFRGVVAHPNANGIPASPTAQTSATIVVGGTHVDFYKYRIGAGAWSAEFPVATPIALSGLGGTVVLSINGRHTAGAYLPDSQAWTGSWIVSGGAPPEGIVANQATPSRSNDVSFTVTGVEEYKAQLDEGAFLVPTSSAIPITYDDLDEGLHSVSVIGRDGTDPFPPISEAVRLYFFVDRNHGTDLSQLTRVRDVNFPDIGSDPVVFSWDGRDDLGVLQPAGWYTIKVSLLDGLSRVTSDVALVQVGDLTGGAGVIDDGGGAQQIELYAAGGWAVWQDQRSGDWDIYAQQVGAGAAAPIVISQTIRNQKNPSTDGSSIVWEERRADGGLDIWIKSLTTPDPAQPVTNSNNYEERNPAVYGSRVVYQSRLASDPSAPWQLYVTDMSTMMTEAIDPSTQDQLEPAIFGRRVVWQDMRDAGAGEIYMKQLGTGQVTRLTNDLNGQYHAAVDDHWVAWTDARHGQLEIYGYFLDGNQERRLTNTPENESNPALQGPWVVYQEDSLGVLLDNIRATHLTSLATVQLTNIASRKWEPYLTDGKLVWRDNRNGVIEAMVGDVPSLMPVYKNASLVLVTQGMVDYLGDAHQLLTLWQQQVGVTKITRYTELIPNPVAEVVEWIGGAPVGPNFPLTAGSFLWVEFSSDAVLELGFDNCDPLDFAIGANVISYSCFPDAYSAFDAIADLGLANVTSLRVLDSFTGKWRVAAVEGGVPVGEDFAIPRSAVLFVDALNVITAWTPGS